MKGLPASANSGGVSSTRVRSSVVLTLPQTLVAETFESARNIALDAIREDSLRAVILELSNVRVMDCTEFEQVRGIAGMARLLGAQAFVVGLRPGVVAYLASNDANTEGLQFEREIEDALDRLAAGAADSTDMPAQDPA
ncbi:MAG: STAS domain-containing protein [Betaproteobacteria bacterium]